MGEHASIKERMIVELEGIQAACHEEVKDMYGRLSLELKDEVRSMFKKEQRNIVALDEQLWVTDQRLGQRIDELFQATKHNERGVAAITADVWGWDADSSVVSSADQ